MAADPERARSSSELTVEVAAKLREHFTATQTYQALSDELARSSACLAAECAKASMQGGVLEHEGTRLYPLTPELGNAVERSRQAEARHRAFLHNQGMIPSNEDVTHDLSQRLVGWQLTLTLQSGSTVCYGQTDWPRTYFLESKPPQITGSFLSWNADGWLYISAGKGYYAVRIFDDFSLGRSAEWLITRLVVR